jgi:hypothetical protein
MRSIAQLTDHLDAALRDNPAAQFTVEEAVAMRDRSALDALTLMEARNNETHRPGDFW